MTSNVEKTLMKRRIRTGIRRFFMVTTVFVLIVIVIAAYFGMQMQERMRAPLSLAGSVTVHLPPGATIRSVAADLHQKGLLDHPRYFVVWGRLFDQAKHLKAGEYRLENGDTLEDLLQRMVAGDIVQHSITLIEGHTFRQFLQTIEAYPYLQHTIGDRTDQEIMAELGYGGEHPEGRFFPDTYYVFSGMKDIDLLQQALIAMKLLLEDEWRNKADGLPFSNAYEALILASIVEKETAVAEERPLIAGVFINRLKRNMRLQTDPTVIYGIENFDGNIRFSDLRKDTPYNTYTRHGLPPTPIAMPGQASIHAVLHPAKTDYLYFVAYSDGSGRHVFSRSLEEHRKAVDRYQRRPSKR